MKKKIQVSLRQIENSDLSALNALINSPFTKIVRFPFFPRATQAWLDKIRLDICERPFLIVATKEDESTYVVGFCSISDIDWVARHGRLFFAMIDRDKYASTIQDFPATDDGLRQILEYGLRSLGLNKIYIEIPDHNKSMPGLEKAGFVVEGVSREAEFLDGKFHHVVVLSITRSEFEAKNAGNNN